MNFCLLTTRGHSLTTLTLALHYTTSTSHWTAYPIIHCTNDTQLISLITQSHTLYKPWTSSAFILAIATLQSPLSNYSLALLVFSCLIPARVSWINPCLAIWTLFAPRLDYCCVPGLSLFALPLLDIVRRSKTHACLRTTLCLALTIPVCRCLTLPVY